MGAASPFVLVLLLLALLLLGPLRRGRRFPVGSPRSFVAAVLILLSEPKRVAEALLCRLLSAFHHLSSLAQLEGDLDTARELRSLRGPLIQTVAAVSAKPDW